MNLETPETAQDRLRLILWGLIKVPDISSGDLRKLESGINIKKTRACGRGLLNRRDDAVDIVCDERAWAYSATIPISAEACRKRSAVIVVEMECHEGRIGIGVDGYGWKRDHR